MLHNESDSNQISSGSKDHGYALILFRPKLIVRTNPKHSRVFVDGKLAGISPIEVRWLHTGMHDLCVRHALYKPYSIQVPFHEDKGDVKLDINLSLADGLIGYTENILIKDTNTGFIHDAELDTDWIVGPDKDTTFDEAMMWIFNLGPGWRMPSESELSHLRRSKRKIEWRQWGPFENSGWWVWSSEKANEGNARCVSFLNGLSDWYGPERNSNMTRVFAIRGEHYESTSNYEVKELDISCYIWTPRTPETQKSGNTDRSGNSQCLKIISHPEAADVYVDDNLLGRSPVSIFSRATGLIRLRLEREPFEIWIEDVYFRGETQTIRFRAEMKLPEGYSQYEKDQFIKHDLTGLVEDLKTGYLWLPSHSEMSFIEACKWVTGLGDGWRLPTMQELTTLAKSEVLNRNSNVFDLYYEHVWSSDAKECYKDVKCFGIHWDFSYETYRKKEDSNDMTAIAIRHLSLDSVRASQ